MILLTEPGDTPSHIANRLLRAGLCQNNIAREIYRENMWTFANQSFEGCRFYGSNLPIWIPGFTDVRKDERQHMIDRLQKSSPQVRHNLAKMMQHGHDPKVAAFAHTLQKKANDTFVEQILKKPETLVENMFTGALGFATERMSKFEAAVVQVREAMYRYQVLDNLYESNMPFAEDAKQTTKESLEKLNGLFSSEVERFKLNEASLYGDISKYKAALWNKGFILNATRDVEMIIRVAKYLKIAGVLATIYCIGKDVVDIIHRIWAGQPWFKKFLEDVAEIAAGIIITTLVGLFIGGGGWIAILAAGIISGTATTYVDNL